MHCNPSAPPRPERLREPLRYAQARRRDAARHLLHPRHVRHSLSLTRPTSLGTSAFVGLQAVVVMLVALPLVRLSPWSHLIGYAALGAMVALFGRFAPAGARGRVLWHAALCQVGAVVTMSVVSWLELPLALQLLVLALLCGAFYAAAMTWQLMLPGPLIFVFAASATLGHPATLAQIAERVGAVVAVSAFAWGLCMFCERWRRAPPTSVLPAALTLQSSAVRLAALRMVVGTGAAAAITWALGAAHPGWAAMGALVVMQMPHLHGGLHRAVQRMGGNLVGALLAWGLLSLDPSPWAVIVLLAALQLVTELVIGSNYGLGQAFVTPMALLMTWLAAPTGIAGDMVAERVLDTLAGAGIGLACLVALSTRHERHQLLETRPRVA